ncbi:MAG TPA: TlpA disulfide reductase family protein [Candidatus Acidoferrales bacterium]
MSKVNVLRIAIVLATAALLAAIFYSRQNPEPPLAPSSPAPDFSFDSNGRSARLGDLRGHVVVLNFWATWCAPCIVEMPSLERLHRALKDKGVIVLAVSVDEDAEAYQRFVREKGLTFSTARDPGQKIAALYGTFKFPETFVIDRQGRVVRKIIGPLEWDQPEVIDFLLALARE